MTVLDLTNPSKYITLSTSTTKHGDNMLYKGQFIARIANDEHAESKIAEFKRQHGQLRLHGRHKDRKGAMAAHGLSLNSHGDIPWRFGTEIVIYRGESGMTYQQFKSVKVGDLVQPYHPAYQQRFGKVGVVVEKKHKDKLKVAFNGVTQWATRQQMILLQEQPCK
jgi:hypothetical protein